MQIDIIICLVFKVVNNNKNRIFKWEAKNEEEKVGEEEKEM